MNTLTLKIIFTVGVLLSVIIRIPYQRETRRNTIIDDNNRMVRYGAKIDELVNSYTR